VDVLAAFAIMSLSVVVLFFIALQLMSRSAGLRD
jgi:hypothetical protein